MPQEADGPGLISILWMIWIYWNIFWWMEQLSSLGQAGSDERADKPPGGTAAENVSALASASAGSRQLPVLMPEILQRDGTATVEAFLDHALHAYETVVSAFDAGDREALRPLLSPEVHAIFCEAIAARETQAIRTETLFSWIEPEIVGARIDGERMEVSVRFTGEFFKLPCAAEPSAAADPEPCRTSETWTFARDSAASSGTWRVVATEADVP